MANKHQISDKVIDLEMLYHILHSNSRLELSPEAIEKIKTCRTYLDNKIRNSTDPLYGINTGFGALYKKNISRDDLETLQVNLVMSHASGAGEKIPDFLVRIMLLLKIQSLSYGHSGVQLQTVERLIDFYNNDVFPVVYEFGSLGASG